MFKSKMKLLAGVGLSLLLIAGVVTAAPGVYEPDTGFEVDGNIAFDGPGGAYDWWNSNTHRPSYPPAILIGDAHSKNVNDDYFSPSGKFDEPENWSIKEGSVGPGQNELTNVFIWALAPGDVGNTDSWLVMGMERVKKSGTFALDFELNQEPWAWDNYTLPHVGGPNRTTGDIAVGFELKGNPTDAQTDLQVLIVQFFEPGEPVPMECSNTIGNGNKLLSVNTGTDACLPYGDTGWYYRFLDNAAILASSGLGTATMNPEGEGFSQSSFIVDDGETYTSYDPQGNVDDYVGEFEFAEAAINLTALGLEPGCPGFGSVHAKSRSSLEVGSDLKDLAGPRPLPVKCYIEGYKYHDINGNGTRDAGEPGLNGWTIELSDGSSVVTMNDANGDPGYYRFDNLADGSYTVNEDCSNQSGWVQTEPYTAGDPLCGDGVYNFNINIANKSAIGNFGNGDPSIDVAKLCTNAVFVGDDIDYEITVTNDGNVDLYDVSVDDSIFGELGPIAYLAAGDSEVFTPSQVATSAGTVNNTVDVEGDFGDTTVYDTVTASDTCATEVYALTVTKTADEFYRRYFEWDITKSVSPATWDLFTGESGTSEYTVELDLVGYTENDWQVTGSITIENPAPMDASLASVIDDAGGITGVVSCPSLTVPAEDSLVCSYDTGEQDAVDANPFGDTNTATATLNNNNGGTTDFVGTAPINFAEATVELIDEEATVSDTVFAEVFGTFTDDYTFTYSRTFSCDGDEGQHDNIASFETNDTQTTGDDDASVTVNCYDLNVSKTADEFYSRYFEWDITKSVSPASWDLFDGESGTSDYTVELIQTGFYENDWQVKGTITIANSHPTRAADLTQVVDSISGFGSVAVDCNGATSVPANDSIDCSYDTGMQDSPDSNPFGDLNSATATQQLYDFDKDMVATPDGTKDYSGTHAIDFSEATVESFDEEATVSDTYAGSTVGGTFTGDKTFTYSRTFSCNGDEGTHPNTASFETNDTPLTGSDDASVTVNCYDLSVEKDASTSFTRTYEWDIDKVVDNPGPITVQRGESVDVNYTVMVDVVNVTDSAWAVAGNITVYNSHPSRDAELTQVIDSLSGFGAVAVDCGGATSVPAGGSLGCTYGTDLPDGTNRTNEATATQQLYDFASDGTATADGTKDYSGNAAVDFSSASINFVDEEVDVNDSYAGYLGTVNVFNDTLPAFFEYPRTITAPDAFCGDLQVDNTAEFTTNDTGTTGSDDASVIISVPCEGCTPGFWQGGSGSQLWDVPNDMDWFNSGYETDYNPYHHTTLFNDFFSDVTDSRLDGMTMYALVSSGGGSDPAVKAARDMVAAYLNESAFGTTFPADSLDALKTSWYNAVSGGDAALDAFHGEVSGWNDPKSIGGYCPLP